MADTRGQTVYPIVMDKGTPNPLDSSHLMEEAVGLAAISKLGDILANYLCIHNEPVLVHHGLQGVNYPEFLLDMLSNRHYRGPHPVAALLTLLSRLLEEETLNQGFYCPIPEIGLNDNLTGPETEG